MSWNEYLRQIAGEVGQAEIARAAGVTAPTVSRWLKGNQGVDPVAAANFARHYRRPVLEAFVAAGFLTPNEAKVRPIAAPDYSALSNEELLELVRSRMTQGGGEHGFGSAPMKQQRGDYDLAADDQDVDPLDEAEETERST